MCQRLGSQLIITVSLLGQYYAVLWNTISMMKQHLDLTNETPAYTLLSSVKMFLDFNHAINHASGMFYLSS